MKEWTLIRPAKIQCLDLQLMNFLSGPTKPRRKNKGLKLPSLDHFSILWCHSMGVYHPISRH